MKSIGDVATVKAAKERKRQWHWCRRGNGFSDMPKWRVVAAAVGLPLFQVVALVNKLEELANDAGNRGLMRGEVTHFDAAEFGVALGMPTEEAALIFDGLRQVGWVVDGLVADFYDRNKDEEDESAPLRARRTRARRRILTALAELGRRGLIAAALRTDFEVRLPSVVTMGDEELFALDAEVQLALSTGACVTRDARRDAVTVTVEESTSVSSAAVDNSGGATRGAAPGQPEQARGDFLPQSTEQAELWLAGAAVRILVAKNEMPKRAETVIARWRRDLDDDPLATAALVAALADASVSMARAELLAADHIKQRRRAAECGEPLPLPPVPLGGRSLSTDRRHGVTHGAVDNSKPAGDSGAPPQRSGTDG